MPEASCRGGTAVVEHSIGRAKMNRPVTNRDLFMRLTSNSFTNGLSGRPWARLYQDILRNKSFLDPRATDKVGQDLISLAESALAFRQYDVLKQASDIMLALPLAKPFKSAGLYYRQLGIRGLGTGNLNEAESVLGLVLESDAPKYRARALTSLGAIQIARMDYAAAIGFYFEALSCARSNESFDPAIVVLASKMIAVVKSMDGSHHAALADLQDLVPLATMVGRQSPLVYYDCLNSLALELASTGQCESARRAATLAVCSPYAKAYPEWRETFDDIRSVAGRRSVVYIGVCSLAPPRPRKSGNILQMLDNPPSPQRETKKQCQPAEVIDFPLEAQINAKRGKKRMGKPIDPSELDSLSTDEKKVICVDTLMKRSADKAWLESLFRYLGEELQARALIELILSEALDDDEVTALSRRVIEPGHMDPS
jgi:tetratricopeptide (TPR) repeat protein